MFFFSEIQSEHSNNAKNICNETKVGDVLCEKSARRQAVSALRPKTGSTGQPEPPEGQRYDAAYRGTVASWRSFPLPRRTVASHSEMLPHSRRVVASRREDGIDGTTQDATAHA